MTPTVSQTFNAGLRTVLSHISQWSQSEEWIDRLNKLTMPEDGGTMQYVSDAKESLLELWRVLDGGRDTLRSTQVRGLLNTLDTLEPFVRFGEAYRSGPQARPLDVSSLRHFVLQGDTIREDLFNVANAANSSTDANLINGAIGIVSKYDASLQARTEDSNVIRPLIDQLQNNIDGADLTSADSLQRIHRVYDAFGDPAGSNNDPEVGRMCNLLQTIQNGDWAILPFEQAREGAATLTALYTDPRIFVDRVGAATLAALGGDATLFKDLVEDCNETLFTTLFKDLVEDCRTVCSKLITATDRRWTERVVKGASDLALDSRSISLFLSDYNTNDWNPDKHTDPVAALKQLQAVRQIDPQTSDFVHEVISVYLEKQLNKVAELESLID